MPRIPEPPPQPENVFVLSTPRSMIAKLSWELAQLRRTTAAQNRLLGAIIPAGYHAFNCAVTAWHCGDWAWASAGEDTKRELADRYRFSLKPRDRDNRESFLDAVALDCRPLEICRQIANSSKHLKLDNKTQPDFKTVTAHAAVPHPQNDQYETQFFLLVIDDDKPFLFTEVVMHALRCWERLYSELGYIEPPFVDGRS